MCILIPGISAIFIIIVFIDTAFSCIYRSQEQVPKLTDLLFQVFYPEIVINIIYETVETLIPKLQNKCISNMLAIKSRFRFLIKFWGLANGFAKSFFITSA